MQSHRFHIRPRLGIARGPRRGIALMWAIIGITVIALLSVAAMHLARGEQMVNDNFDSGRRALYLADQALSQFYADFRPTANLSVPDLVSTVEDVDSLDLEPADDGATTDVNSTFEGADLKVTNLSFENGDAIVTPYKIVESQYGDIYLLESTAAVYDSRGDRPDAVRTLRTYASLVPPFKLRGALNAPGRVITTPAGKANKDGTWSGCPSGQCDHFHLDGGKKGKCGSGIAVPPLATPSVGYSKLTSNKVHLKTSKDGVVVDSTTDNYRELMDSLHVDFAAMTQDAYYAGVTNFIDVPRDYPTINQVPFNTFTGGHLWPVILVHGDAVITTKTKGFGMLVVEGSLTLATQNLEWKGVILTGKSLNVTGTAHLHEHGAVAAGLYCTDIEAAAGLCNVNFSGAHLGIAYAQCEAEAAWAQLLVLRPLTPSRHTRLY
jgi:hypothetical protein